MAGTWRSARVFLSSTFRDMHAERDHLVKVVFPELRERLLPYRVYLDDIDLRWGITTEQAENDKVLDLCLQQIDECRPFFIGLLGERYGWVPQTISEAVRAHYGWVQRETGKSVTELEILFGALLNDPTMRGRCFFYFRDPEAVKTIPEPLRSRIFVETDAELIRKLTALKEKIRKSGYPVFEGYPAHWGVPIGDRPTKSSGRLVGLEEFGNRVRDQLWEAINTELHLPGQPPAPAAQNDSAWLVAEVDAQARFVESRLRVYVGRDDLQRELVRHAQGDESKPCLVTGPGGSGKSSALARFVAESAKALPHTLVIAHFIGASTRSTALRDVLKRLCNELFERQLKTEKQIQLAEITSSGEDVETLRQVIETEFAVPNDIVPLATTWRKFLKMVPAQHRVVIVLDALNQLEEADRARELWWLPRELPPHVRVIASSIVDPAAPDAANDPVASAFRSRSYHTLRVGGLTRDEREAILREVPSLSAKTLEDAQVRRLLENSATENPLYLRVALEELRGFGSFEQLDNRIDALPRVGKNKAARVREAGFSPEAMRKAGDPLTALFVQVTERLELEFDVAVVRLVLTSLAAARRGLSERELQGILAESPGAADLFPVLRQLRPYLVNHGGLLGFFHTSLLRAVQGYLLETDDKQSAVHSRLGDYFDGQDNWIESFDIWHEQVTQSPILPRLANVRKVDELVWQRIEARQWDHLARTLTDLDFLEAKTEGDRVFDLANDLAKAFEKMPEEHPARRHFRLLERAIRNHIHFLVRHPTTLFQCLWNLCWWYDCPEAAAHYDSSDEPALPPASSSRLSGLLENWRKAKEAAQPGFRWLRSLRPPPTRLDSGLQAVLRGHTGPVPAVDFSPEGRRIASGSWDRTVRVWDADSGYELGCLQGHTNGVRSVAFSPDGRRIASGSEDCTVRVWDVDSGHELVCFRGHSSTVAGVVYSPDGRRIASGSEDCTVRIWDADSGQERVCLQEASSSTRPCFSPDGRRIVSGSNGNCLSVWDSDSGRELVRSRVPGGIICCVRFSLDGGQIFTGSRGGEICLWNADSGEGVGSSRGNSQIMGVMLAPDCQRVADVFWDCNIRVWKTFSAREFAICRGADAINEGIAFSHDGRRIACGSWDHAVRVWDADFSGGPSSLRGHTTEIAGIEFSPDGRLVASHSEDGSLRVWNAGSGRELACFRDSDYSSEIVRVVFAPDGRWLAFSRSNGTTRVWDAQSGGEPVTLQGLGPRVTGWMKQLDFTPDARSIVGVLLDDTVVAWNPKTGARLEAHESQRAVPGPAPANSEYPWRARSEPGGDTVIVPASGGPAVAWFPATPDHLKTAPSGRLWAGNVFKHLYLIRLEGDARFREQHWNG